MGAKPLFEKLDRRNWPFFALGKIHSAADVRRVRAWCKENCDGDYYLQLIKETRGTRKMTIATVVRLEREDDALMFKLTWADYE